MSIKETLIELGIISESNSERIADGTRDNKNLAVHKDSISGVIYIDDFYVGDDTYLEGKYRIGEALVSLEDFEDSERRAKDFRRYYQANRILDFGCGIGSFLRLVSADCKSAVGVELQQDARQNLKADGIECYRSLDEIEDGSLDAIFMFHVLEHLNDPLGVLKSIRKKLGSGGVLVAEVPHARDFLLSNAYTKEFLDFTLWSQHLILHTRESLDVFLKEAGYQDIVIKGVQRFPLSNHLSWLKDGKPGGHKGTMSSVDTQELTVEYGKALNMIDATDSLVAVAKAG